MEEIILGFYKKFNPNSEGNGQFRLYDRVIQIDSKDVSILVKDVDNIPSNQKYFYPIVLVRLDDEIYVPKKIIDDARMGKCYLSYIYAQEGDIWRLRHIFRKSIKKLKIPKKQVLVFHGDLRSKKFFKEPYTYFPISCFPWWIRQFQQKSLVEFNPEYLYLNYNRIMKKHRMTLIYEIMKNNLLDKGLVSFNMTGTHEVECARWLSCSAKDAKNIISLGQFSPDNINFVKDNPAVSIVFDHYTRSFLSLVSETHANDDIIFLSEKTFKPILVGHPFILLSNPGSLNKLKEFGFKTFSHWWDESYDNETDQRTRIKKIVKILKLLSRKSDEELINIRKEMQPVLSYNQNLYNNIVNTKDGVSHPVLLAMKKILDNHQPGAE